MKTPVIEALPDTLEQLETIWPELLKNILAEARSPAAADEVIGRMKQEETFMDLVRGWENMPTTAQANAWNMIQERLWEAAIATREYCVRCGECCLAGSPTIYDQDRPSLASGAIKRSNLLTLRSGEKAWSNRENRYVVLEREQIKIKSQADSRACIFLSPGHDACYIYPDRPFQCQVLECWDPSRFQTVINLPPVTRLDLLGRDNPLSRIIEQHEERCGIKALADALEADETEKALDMVLFDLHVREFVKEKFALPEDELDFFLGRPPGRDNQSIWLQPGIKRKRNDPDQGSSR